MDSPNREWRCTVVAHDRGHLGHARIRGVSEGYLRERRSEPLRVPCRGAAAHPPPGFESRRVRRPPVLQRAGTPGVAAGLRVSRRLRRLRARRAAGRRQPDGGGGRHQRRRLRRPDHRQREERQRRPHERQRLLRIARRLERALPDRAAGASLHVGGRRGLRRRRPPGSGLHDGESRAAVLSDRPGHRSQGVRRYPDRRRATRRGRPGRGRACGADRDRSRPATADLLGAVPAASIRSAGRRSRLPPAGRLPIWPRRRSCPRRSGWGP